MNRTLTNVLFGGIGTVAQSDYKIEGAITKTSVDETVDALGNADSVILVRTQHLTKSFAVMAHSTSPLLPVPGRSSDTEWRSQKRSMPSRRLSTCLERKALLFALLSTPLLAGELSISTVMPEPDYSLASSRMPGQCNVLLAEASVPYDSTCFHVNFRVSPHSCLNSLYSRARDGRDQ